MPFHFNLSLFRIALYALLVGPLSSMILPRAEIMMKGLFSFILFCLSAARLHETSRNGGAYGRSHFLTHFLSHDHVSMQTQSSLSFS